MKKNTISNPIYTLCFLIHENFIEIDDIFQLEAF